jgi:hypothetical protein
MKWVIHPASKLKVFVNVQERILIYQDDQVHNNICYNSCDATGTCLC